MSYLDWEKKKHGVRLMQTLVARGVKCVPLQQLAALLPEAIRKKHADALAKATEPPFRVYVKPQQASNGLTYFVMLMRTDLDNKPSCRTDGLMSVINRHNVDEANAEGYAWASFLGVEFTPCEAVPDTAAKNTVPEYGEPHAPDILKLVEVYKKSAVRLALVPTDLHSSLFWETVKLLCSSLDKLKQALRAAKLLEPAIDKAFDDVDDVEKHINSVHG